MKTLAISLLLILTCSTLVAQDFPYNSIKEGEIAIEAMKTPIATLPFSTEVVLWDYHVLNEDFEQEMKPPNMLPFPLPVPVEKPKEAPILFSDNLLAPKACYPVMK